MALFDSKVEANNHDICLNLIDEEIKFPVTAAFSPPIQRD